MTAPTPISPKHRDAVLQSLKAGVVPRAGQHLIQVGRVAEVKALLADIERTADGGSGFRFVIGEYGSGKTFFLNLIRAIALEKKLVTLTADLGPDRRLQATGGQARSLYAELLRNMATRAKPEGNALASVVERFVTTAMSEAETKGTKVEAVIRERLTVLSDYVGGYDFASVIGAYWRGHSEQDEVLKANAVRWLRGEFSTKTEARNALGVRTIVDDQNVYDQLKLLARFVRLAGYSGLVICMDEMVNLFKLSNTQARTANYEQILRMLNDSLQGTAGGLTFLMGGTPEFLMDPRKGLFSYPALQSRLAENSFAKGGLTDMTGPVLRLVSLTREDLLVLLQNIRHVFASGDSSKYLVPDEALVAFMEHCSKRVGEAYFRTPRTTIKQFVDLLSIIDQNPGNPWQTHLSHVAISAENNPDLAPLEGEDEPPSEPAAKAKGNDEGLASFKL